MKILKEKLSDFIVNKNKSPWEKVCIVRDKERPTALEYIENIVSNFMELHGDRYFGDDRCIIGGIGTIGKQPVTVIAQQKGKSIEENIKRNFGMPQPEGYRKALRLMKQAEKFNRPIVCFVDTPGAFCGIGAEERGQGEAIARNLLEMANLKVPIISIFIGEGGSGGALALAVANKIWMLENAIYSLLSPEGFASILWKDATKSKEAAEIMKITAEDLMNFGIIDGIIEEPKGDASKDVVCMSKNIKEVIIKEINNLKNKNIEEIVEERYNKFRNMGKFYE